MPIAVHNLSSGHLEQIDLWHGSDNVDQSIDSTQAVDYRFEEDLRRPRLDANRAGRSGVLHPRIRLQAQSSSADPPAGQSGQRLRNRVPDESL